MPKAWEPAAASWVNSLLSFFYPEVCQLCGRGRATPAQGYVCAHCQARVQWVVEPFCARCGLPHQGAITNDYTCGNCHDLELYFESARSAALAKGSVLEAIHAYKYKGALWLEPFLLNLLLNAALPVLSKHQWDILIPVPLHPLKLREREFNQSERLARALSNNTGIELNARSLQRLIPTRTQTALSRKERQENIRNAFSVGHAPSVCGKRVVLIDDVFTTGSTTNECARVLLQAGALTVCVWTLARGI